MKIWLTGIVILSVAYLSFLILTIRMMLLDMDIGLALRAWMKALRTRLKKVAGSSVIRQSMEREKALTFKSAKMTVQHPRSMPLLHTGRAIRDIKN